MLSTHGHKMFYIFMVFLATIYISNAHITSFKMDYNRTTNRAKRFILFDGGGISKLVFGFSQPIDSNKKSLLKNMNIIYNFQVQYTPLPEPILWPSIWEGAESSRQFQRSISNDRSREIVYSFIEEILDSNGFNGEQCLLKAICQVAHTPIDGSSIFYDILRGVLIPIVDNIDQKYLDARKAGLYGVNCSSCYSKCENMIWLEMFSKYL